MFYYHHLHTSIPMWLRMYVHAHVTHTNRLLFKKDLPETTGKKKYFLKRWLKIHQCKIIKTTCISRLIEGSRESKGKISFWGWYWIGMQVICYHEPSLRVMRKWCARAKKMCTVRWDSRMGRFDFLKSTISLILKKPSQAQKLSASCMFSASCCIYTGKQPSLLLTSFQNRPDEPLALKYKDKEGLRNDIPDAAFSATIQLAQQMQNWMQLCYQVSNPKAHCPLLASLQPHSIIREWHQHLSAKCIDKGSLWFVLLCYYFVSYFFLS